MAGSPDEPEAAPENRDGSRRLPCRTARLPTGRLFRCLGRLRNIRMRELSAKGELQPSGLAGPPVISVRSTGGGNRVATKSIDGEVGFADVQPKGSELPVSCGHGWLAVVEWLTESQRMQPVAARAGVGRSRHRVRRRAVRWLLLDHGELAWFSDLKGLGYKRNQPQLRHYRYQVRTKPSGSIRLIEAEGALEGAATANPGRNSREDSAASRGAGVPERAVYQDVRRPARGPARGIADGLAGFLSLHRRREDFRRSFARWAIPNRTPTCSGAFAPNATPRDVWKAAASKEAGFDIPAAQLREARALYARPHLPQGAPTSPAMASLCAYRVDCRLAGLAKSVGAEYTRYADDLAFPVAMHLPGGWRDSPRTGPPSWAKKPSA